MAAGLSSVVRRRRKAIVTPLHPQSEDDISESPPRRVLDYATGQMVDESEMPVGSERWAASERAFWAKARS